LRERFVITHRYQLNGPAPTTETLEQVGKALGLSKERVRQLQNAALGKSCVRHSLQTGSKLNCRRPRNNRGRHAILP
jgi:DNA-directed RNA polymerase sigma subunit (sigma70/sigma32)